MSGSGDIIQVEGLSKRFGDKIAVDKLSLRVRAGEIYGFLGPNGSGKTTAIRMLCGLLVPDAGRGTCLGFDIRTQSADIKRHTGYMPQSFSLYQDLSVRENLDFVARMYSLKPRAPTVDRCIERFDLGAYRRQLAGHLSGGWKQRLALAACLLHQPRLLLLDEPTAGIDPKARREFWDQVHQLAAEGLAILVSTHYMDEAERCHRLAYLAYGRLLAHGTVREVVQRAGLTTWQVSGAGLAQLARQLRGLPGVEQVAAFGDTLHVSGADAALLAQSIARFQGQGYHWTQIQPGLEEVFIGLMQNSGEPAA